MSKKETFKIETPHGTVELKTDEHWAEVQGEEREAVADFVRRCVGDTIEEFHRFNKTNEEFGFNVNDYGASLTFEQAKKASNAVVIMEGDWGGQIYLTCSMKYVKCSYETLVRLLKDIDPHEWACNDGDGRSLDFRRKNPGESVSGGMGGGEVSDVMDGPWVHESLESHGFKEIIKQVLEGKIDSITELYSHLPRLCAMDVDEYLALPLERRQAFLDRDEIFRLHQVRELWKKRDRVDSITFHLMIRSILEANGQARLDSSLCPFSELPADCYVTAGYGSTWIDTGYGEVLGINESIVKDFINLAHKSGAGIEGITIEYREQGWHKGLCIFHHQLLSSSTLKHAHFTMINMCDALNEQALGKPYDYEAEMQKWDTQYIGTEKISLNVLTLHDDPLCLEATCKPKKD